NIAKGSRIPLLRNYYVRTIAGDPGADYQSHLMDILRLRPKEWATLLREANEGLKGVRQAPMPKAWPELYAKLIASPNAGIRSEATALALTYGDPTAIAAQRAVLTDVKAGTRERLDALAALTKIRVGDLAPTLQSLLAESAIRGPAI